MKILYRIVFGLIILYPLISGMACQPAANPLPPQSASLKVSKDLGTLNRELFGTNLQWEYSGDGILVEPNSGATNFHSQALSATKQLQISSVRFPGGSLANTYDWKNGIGPVNKRKDGVSFSGKPTPSHFGTDEFLAFTNKINAAPVLTVNLNWTEEHAKAWVKYILDQQKQNRSKKFAAYWELGNELYSPHEPGHSTAAEYAKRANSMAKTLKSLNPKIKTGAILDISFIQAAWMGSVFPHMTTWNEEVIKDLSDDIDFVSVHFYAPFDKLWDTGQLSKLTLAGPIVFRQNIQAISNLLKKYNKGHLEIAVTEYNTFFGDKIKLDPRTGGTEAALFNALMLMEMAKLPEVTLANHWSLVNNSVFGLIKTKDAHQAQQRPSFDVFQTLSTQAGNPIKTVDISGPGYDVSAIGNIPTLQNVPMLKAILTKDKQGNQYLNIVNRSWNQPINANLSDITKTSTVTLSQWSGYGNESWKNATTNQSVALDSGQITIPPHSFSVIRWKN